MAVVDGHSLMFGIRRSIRYHARRRGFLEGVDRVSSVALIFLGSAAFAYTVDAKWGWLLQYSGLAVTFIATVRLIFAISARAAIHAQFVKDFARLEQKLSRDSSDENIQEVYEERVALDATEPPVLRVLDAMCHNEVLRAFDYPQEEYARISPTQRALAHFFSWKEHTIKKQGHPSEREPPNTSAAPSSPTSPQ